ncbi:MAG: hypothetical protein Q7U75_13730, partial [Desulfobacterales bacterium]|nr:hypothetical protein [Desulfobacterales bacterium]
TAADGPRTLIYTVRVIADMPTGTTNVDNVVVIIHPRDDNPANNTASERVIVRVADEPFLPFTGGEYALLLGLAMAAAALGLLLRSRPAGAI